MRRPVRIALAAALVLGAALALAQGELSGVTMRVVEDLTGLDVTVIELDEGDAEPSP